MCSSCGFIEEHLQYGARNKLSEQVVKRASYQKSALLELRPSTVQVKLKIPYQKNIEKVLNMSK